MHRIYVNKNLGEHVYTWLVHTQGTSENTREKLEVVFGSRKENRVAGERVGGSFYCTPFCAFGILYHVNEFPIHKNK